MKTQAIPYLSYLRNSYISVLYVSKLDSEEDIQMGSEKVAKDNGWSKIHALSVLLSKYQSQRIFIRIIVLQSMILFKSYRKIPRLCGDVS